MSCGLYVISCKIYLQLATFNLQQLFNNDILLKEANEFEKTTALIRIYLCFVVRLYVLRKTSYVQPSIPTEESFGRLVLLGYDVTTFRPVTYQRSSLLRPSMEVSSRG